MSKISDFFGKIFRKNQQNFAQTQTPAQTPRLPLRARIIAAIFAFFVVAAVAYNVTAARFDVRFHAPQATWLHLFSGAKTGGIYKYTSKGLFDYPGEHRASLPILKADMIYIEFSVRGLTMRVEDARFKVGLFGFAPPRMGLFYNSIAPHDLSAAPFVAPPVPNATTKVFFEQDAGKVVLFQLLNGVVFGAVGAVVAFLLAPFVARFFAGDWARARAAVGEFLAAPNLKFALGASFALYIIALAAIIRADAYFIDDANRAIQMRDFWENGEANRMGRWGFTIFHNVIAMFKDFVDVSPLTHIIAAATLAASGVVLLWVVRRRLDLIGVLAVLPVGLFPFFMENLSYKYDSPVMSLAIFFAVVPFLFRAHLRLFCAVSVAGLFAMYSCYQSAGGIYIVLAAFFVAFELGYGAASARAAAAWAGRFAACAAGSFAAGTLAYKLASPVVTDYVSNAPLAFGDIIAGGNAWRYLQLVWTYGEGLPTIYISGVVGVAFVAAFVALSPRKLIAAVAAVCFAAVCAVLFMGGYIVLEVPLYAPRVFVSLGVVVSVWASFVLFWAQSGGGNSGAGNSGGNAGAGANFGGGFGAGGAQNFAHNVSNSNLAGAGQNFTQNDGQIFTTNVQTPAAAQNFAQAPAPAPFLTAHAVKKTAIYALVCALAISVVSFANAYGNALKKQDEWTKMRFELALADLNAFVPNMHAAGLVLGGDIGFPRSVRYFLDTYGALGRHIFTHRLNAPASTNTYWLPSWYGNGFGWGTSAPQCAGVGLAGLEKGEVLRSGFYHTLRRVGSCYYVKFNAVF